MKIKLIHLFSGLGAPEKALKRLGIDISGHQCCEIDKFAIKAYNAIHGDTFNYGDISLIKEEDIIKERDRGEIDMVVYGFPCTDLSVSGQQKGMEKGSGTRSSLLWEVEKFIKCGKPKYLIMENVKNLIGNKFKKYFEEWLSLLDGYGYKSYYKVLNARDYNIPQNRERVFVVSIRKDLNKDFEFPNKQELKTKLKDLLEDNPEDYYYNVCKSMRNAVEIGKCKDITNKEYCQTITTKQARWNNAGMIRDKRGLRYLTSKELFRLMGFDDDDYYKVKEASVSITQMYKIMGNSIVVNVLEEIFNNLLLK